METLENRNKIFILYYFYNRIHPLKSSVIKMMRQKEEK